MKLEFEIDGEMLLRPHPVQGLAQLSRSGSSNECHHEIARRASIKSKADVSGFIASECIDHTAHASLHNHLIRTGQSQVSASAASRGRKCASLA